MPTTFEKLNLKDQREIWVLDAPASFEPELAGLSGVTVHRDLKDGGDIGFVLAFVTQQQRLDEVARTVAGRAQGDVIVWIAYPKKSSKKYKCEFNRDSGWEALGKEGFEGVRMIAIDEDWSALRFRRAEFIKSMSRDPKRAMSEPGKARTSTATSPGTETRDWKGMRDLSARLLQERTGEGVDAWNARIQKEDLKDKESLREWLGKQGVTGYAQTLLVMERFGYPDFFLASADELIGGQYADRPQLRAILDAILDAAAGLGEVVVQTRKTYISLVTPRRTFARIQPTTRDRVDLGLRLDGQEPAGRLQPSKIHDTMRVQISLRDPEEVDSEVLDWLQKAYEQSC